MALQVGVNSYVEVTDATAYFADRFGYSKWAGEANQAGALISATQIFDLLCSWYGEKLVDSQELAFPRDADGVPQAVKDAQCEIAYLIIEQGSASTATSDALEEMKAGSVAMKFKARNPKHPFKTPLVMDLVSGLGFCSGGSIIPVLRG